MFKIFSKKLLVILLILISSFIIGLRTSIGFFYLFFWFLSAVLSLGLIWVTLEYFGAGLSFARNTPNRIQEGDILEIETAITNNGFMPLFNFVLGDYLGCASYQGKQESVLIDYLGRRVSFKVKYGCPCPNRGRYAIGPITAYFFDPFGLFFFRKTFPVYSELYVYPKTFSIKKFPVLAKGILPWFGIETTHTSGDEDEFFGVREYKQGDPISRIHWFSSARKNTLMVKQFQRQSYFRATVIFNLEEDKNFGEGKERVAEYIIRIAASVARHLVSRNVSVELLAHTREAVHIPFNRGAEHLDDIMKFLAVAKPESKVTLGEVFQEYARYIPDNSCLIIIMLEKDWQHLPQMLPLAKRNISLVPLILMSSTFRYSFEKKAVLEDAKQKISQVFNFKPIIFSRGDDLEEIFLKY